MSTSWCRRRKNHYLLIKLDIGCKMNNNVNSSIDLLRQWYSFHSLKSLLETKVGIGINCNSPHLNVYETSWKSRTFVLVCLFVCLLAWWCLTPLSTILQLYRAVIFIGGGNRSTRRKPPTRRKAITNFITLCYINYTGTHKFSGDWDCFHR